MTLLPSLRDLLQVFSAEMTAPTFRNFLVITAGWLFAARHTVAAAVQASGNARKRHHSAFYSTFSRAAWDVDQVGWNLADKILEAHHPDVDKPIEVGADDTNAAKSGRKIFGTGWHYDPLADSPKGKGTTWAHNWVALAILAEPLREQAKRVALGVQARLYLPPKTAEKQNLPYRTKLDHLADMLRTLCESHAARKFRLLVDAAYGVGEMITRLPSNCDLISRLRSDARLFRPVEAVPPNARRKAGRPRVRGPEMDKAAAIFAKRKRRSVATLTLYGKAKKVEWVTVLACVYQAPSRLLKVVIVQFPEEKGRKPALVTLYSTDLDMSPEEIIEAYCRRWSIEETFQEAKGHLGLDEPQCRSRKAVERMVPTILYLHAILWLWAGEERLGRQAAKRKAPWNRSTVNLSIGDILEIAREKHLAEMIKSNESIGPILRNLAGSLARLLRAG
jgi:hypothetical protein